MSNSIKLLPKTGLDEVLLKIDTQKYEPYVQSFANGLYNLSKYNLADPLAISKLIYEALPEEAQSKLDLLDITETIDKALKDYINESLSSGRVKGHVFEEGVSEILTGQCELSKTNGLEGFCEGSLIKDQYEEGAIQVKAGHAHVEGQYDAAVLKGKASAAAFRLQADLEKIFADSGLTGFKISAEVFGAEAHGQIGLSKTMQLNSKNKVESNFNPLDYGAQAYPIKIKIEKSFQGNYCQLDTYAEVAIGPEIKKPVAHSTPHSLEVRVPFKSGVVEVGSEFHCEKEV